MDCQQCSTHCITGSTYRVSSRPKCTVVLVQALNGDASLPHLSPLAIAGWQPFAAAAPRC